LDWNELVGEVADFAQVPDQAIDRQTLLIEDLGLDSLALTELLITLIEEYEIDALSAELFARTWERVSIGELFEIYCNPSETGSPGAAQGSVAS
jgi:acyl carrier protein